MEELVGDIADETEPHETAVRMQSDGTALVPGWVPTRKVNRLLGMALPIEHESTTIAGLCMVTAQMVPEVGSTLTASDGTQLEIVEASAKRVRLVRILKPSVVDA